jgi:hypothetical protein
MRALLLAAAVVLLSAAAPAQAKLPSSIEATMVPGGSLAVTSPPIPPGLMSLDIEAAQKRQAEEDERANLSLAVVGVLLSKPDRKARLVTCGAIAEKLLEEAIFEGISAEGASFAVLFLRVCVQMAKTLAPGTPFQSAGAAATSCKRLTATVRIKVTRAGAGYNASVVRRVKRRAPLRTSCRRTASGFRIKVRPTSRRKTLRQVAGPTVGIGFANTGGSSLTVRTTFRAGK